MPPMHSARSEDSFEVASDLAGVSPAEWLAVSRGHCNILLEGPHTSTEAALRLLLPHLRGIVHWKARGAALQLPPADAGTLILQDVSGLQASEQRALHEWLSGTGQDTQIVSTTAHPLFLLVQRGLFDERLYYRLNVLLVPLE